MAANICITCKNSCGLCAWSADLKPVKGWSATPIKKKQSAGVIVDSFYITDCPQFEYDERPKQSNRWTCTDTVLLKRMLKQRLRHKRIAEILNKPINTVKYKIYLLKKEELK